MGKRELVIILGFLATGVLAYQFTATPSEPGRGFSPGRLIDAWRREARANLERRTATHEGVLAADGRAEVRLSNIRQIEVVGEARSDIGYRLTVEAAGPDVAAAEAHARETRLVEDDLGETLALAVRGPDGVQQTSSLELRVPRDLAVRVEAARRVTVAEVAAVYLEGTSGDAAVRVVGVVSGTHRNGPLTVEDAGGVDLTLSNSDATLTRITGEAAIHTRNGSTRISAASGPVTVEHNSGTLRIVEAAGVVRVSGRDGEVTIERPGGEVRVDLLAAIVSIVLTKPVDVTVLTTRDAVTLEMTGELPISIDAAALEGGSIDARTLGLTPETIEGGARLRHTFGNAARISIRNRRGAIVIAKTK
jgi:hypothetical protein